MSETEHAIYFFGNKGKYGYLSNFYTCSFTDENGVEYANSEQYFMYHKALCFDPGNSVLLSQILKEKDPRRIKSLGRSVKHYSDKIWSAKRFDIMLQGLTLKFEQSSELSAKLCATGAKMLYEASPYDKIWGIGIDQHAAMTTAPEHYRGQNLLGKALMIVKERLSHD